MDGADGRVWARSLSWVVAVVSQGMTTTRLDLAYHGAGFAGWAAQPGMRTVQGELERAIERIIGAPAQLTVAGRTDAGVHAWAQVASFVHSGDLPEGFVRGLNSLTGDDLAVLAATPAEPGIDAAATPAATTHRRARPAWPTSVERGLSSTGPT